MVERGLLFRGGMALAVLLAVVAAWALDRPGGRWGRRLRSRLLLGVPWGTLVLSALVLAVYLFVQNGATSWYGPLTIPFASWSYLYPQGMVLAPFSHQGPDHLVGNLIGTLVFAPIAEYAVGHFPARRGAESFRSWRSNPYVRAFLVFPLAGLLVGLATSLLHWGPIIGFSGVVFAFAGVALVRYPLATVVALVGRRLLDLLLVAAREPVDTVTAGTEFTRPAWAGVAVQGHLLGFLLGVVLGFAAIGRREGGPGAARTLLGATLFGVGTSAWAVWWFGGANEYVLFRGLGVVVVIGMGLAATLAARQWSGDLFGVPTRTVVALVLLLPLVTMAVVAVPVNLTTVDSTAVSDGVSVQDYTVTYEEGVINPKASVLDVELFNVSSTTPTGGVIVVSERRSLWNRAISPGRLASSGREFVRVGDSGWETRVLIRRQGWSPRGGATVYRVLLGVEGSDWTPVFTSGSATADATVAGRNVSVATADGDFFFNVSRNDSLLGRTPIPGPDEAVNAGGIRFVRDGDTVTAVRNDTRVPIATRESYD